ncbi:AraC family transcriptional regulator [Celerinatantimonas diazotrophica]|uniref:AraC family transcriptional regulator n=1 Tax=Celerinatantimonas diazotrophica TaxID=412034 RepID=A0A4R1JNG3_9GAMM|nr:AraC family transcriptional regulator [Celerinatantimonas diazotrophica]TCK52059.1 AraC family transcriptional regulator [Celerinatantimonas diazotrophica]CAG9296238.1 HTH-type transcriptional activator RhaR [Celerinatantimonas diazotrophica]
MPIQNSLSIRSYNLVKKGHSHPYHQLVLPVMGSINIEVAGFSGKVLPGECVVVKAEQTHYFTSEPKARFVVADLNCLPENIAQAKMNVFSVSQPLLHYLHFIDEQLKYQINQTIETLMVETFCCLLSEQPVTKRLDRRIQNVLEYIQTHLAEPLNNELLSCVACLSQTQFKKLFKEQTGLTVTQYLTQVRMNKAQALLLHTDYPIQMVAEVVGYQDHAAFSRRFFKYSGLTPSQFAR